MSGALHRLRRRLLDGVPERFLQNVSWQYFGSMYTMLLGFAFAIGVGRGLGATDFGLLTISLSFGAIIFQLVELRLNEAVIRYVSEYWEKGDEERTVAAVKLSLVADVLSCAAAALIMALVSGWAADSIIRDERGSLTILLAAPGLFLATTTSATALGLLRLFGRFRALAGVTVLRETLRTSGAIAGIWLFGLGPLGVLCIVLLARALANGVQLWLAWRELRSRTSAIGGSGLRLLGPELGEIGRFVRSTYFISLTSIPTKELDVNLLGAFTSLQTVGVYKVAKTFMAGLWMLSDSAFLVVYPDLARMWSRRALATIRQFVSRLMVVSGLAGLALYVGSILAVPVVIELALGEAYASAGSLFRWMAWGIVAWAPLVWVNPLLMSAGRPDLTLRASVVGGVVTTALYVVAIPAWEGVGAAWVNALSTPIAMALALWMGWRHEILTQVWGGSDAPLEGRGARDVE